MLAKENRGCRRPANQKELPIGQSVEVIDITASRLMGTDTLHMAMLGG